MDYNLQNRFRLNKVQLYDFSVYTDGSSFSNYENEISNINITIQTEYNKNPILKVKSGDFVNENQILIEIPYTVYIHTTFLYTILRNQSNTPKEYKIGIAHEVKKNICIIRKNL